MRAMLQKMRAEVEKHCDYVGPQFAEKVGRSTAARATSAASLARQVPEQAEALADEGIEVSRIPWVPRADG